MNRLDVFAMIVAIFQESELLSEEDGTDDVKCVHFKPHSKVQALASAGKLLHTVHEQLQTAIHLFFVTQDTTHCEDTSNDFLVGCMIFAEQRGEHVRAFVELRHRAPRQVPNSLLQRLLHAVDDWNLGRHA